MELPWLIKIETGGTEPSPMIVRRHLRAAQGYAELGLLDEGLQELARVPGSSRCMLAYRQTAALLEALAQRQGQV